MIAIIDYGLGNLASVLNAFVVMEIPVKITNNIIEIQNAEKIILPGVGAFREGIANLNKNGLREVLNQEIMINKKPFLGICLGMQLICKKSYEDGELEGLGWIDAEVIRFNFENAPSEYKKLKIPHVGWNDVKCNLASPLFREGRKNQTFYFVHSYYVRPKDKSIVIGSCNYGIDFCAVLHQENIFATQFHPEKSQHEGLEVLRKFAAIKTFKKTS